MSKTPHLDAAYALSSPDDNRTLYADWAQSYDETFTEATGYAVPHHIAHEAAARGGLGPVLDVGAGTGAVATEIAARIEPIDALDLSPEMLEVARSKGLYRDLITADLTQTLEITDETYDTIVSAGTFTHGHVGPDALDELIRVARRGALFVLSVNAAHFGARGFTAKFASLADRITDDQILSRPIYGGAAPKGHADDTTNIVVFRKA